MPHELTPEQREWFVCCDEPRRCPDDHYHERAVAQMLADERERIAREIEARRDDVYAKGSDAWHDLTDAARIARGQA